MHLRRAFARTGIVWSVAAAVAAAGSYFSSAYAGVGARDLVDDLRFGPGVVNHPVGMVPSHNVDIPADWPLEPGGTVGCVTCHYQLPAFDGTPDPFLRDFDPAARFTSAFCTNCHTDDPSAGAVGAHWMAIERAHLGTGNESLVSVGGGLDSESRRCLECHDGVTASDASGGGSGHATTSFTDQRSNHPVGVDYPPRSSKQSRWGYRAVAMLPDEMRLPGGMVSCVSCHNLYDREKRLLTVENAGSALCLSCHAMD